MLLLVALLSQALPAPPSEPASGGTVLSLERFQQEWDRPRIEFEPVPTEATFRVRVDRRVLRLAPPWQPPSGTAHYIRPQMTSTHYEFLMAVVPEEFRAATIYPCCINLLAVAEFLIDKVSSAQKANREARAKREVERALQLFESSRKK